MSVEQAVVSFLVNPHPIFIMLCLQLPTYFCYFLQKAELINDVAPRPIEDTFNRIEDTFGVVYSINCGERISNAA